MSDPHSFADPAAARVTHVGLELTVDFEDRTLSGWAELAVDGDGPLTLDCDGLAIDAVRARAGDDWLPREFTIGRRREHLGEPLTIARLAQDRVLRVYYRTAADAAALQWLQPEQTHAERAPFLFTQGQAILTRSWIPLQDSPGIRVTYEAAVHVPRGHTAVMSAEPLPQTEDGTFRFRMPHPVPPYLIALAVGHLERRDVSARCAVWAEPTLVQAAARELEDVEAMLAACEREFGPYRWGRYDVLVLPPSFPFGGMENPTLTFATPTILAGDKSLVALIAHELAHSWSGNLVTNATWRDFWLNEGFTVYLEQRIMELVYGPERAAMEIALGLEGLEKELAELPAKDQVLHIDLAGRNPDDGMTAVPYDKGAAFLRRLEQVFGRDRFDAFLQRWFDQHAFCSVTTADFLAFLRRQLLDLAPAQAAQVDVEQWVYGAGLPADAPRPQVAAFAAVDAARERWSSGGLAAADLGADGWITHQWLRFLAIDHPVPAARLAELDAAWQLTASRNSEILAAWLELATRNGCPGVDRRLREFLLEVGRRKFLKPLYQALKDSGGDGLQRARRVYAEARPRYHAIARRTLDELLGMDGP